MSLTARITCSTPSRFAMALAGATAGLDQAVSGLKESRSKKNSLDKPRDPSEIMMDTQVSLPSLIDTQHSNRATECGVLS